MTSVRQPYMTKQEQDQAEELKRLKEPSMSDLDHASALADAQSITKRVDWPPDWQRNLARCYLAVLERDARLAGEMRAAVSRWHEGTSVYDTLYEWADQLGGKP